MQVVQACPFYRHRIEKVSWHDDVIPCRLSVTYIQTTSDSKQMLCFEPYCTLMYIDYL